MPPSASNWVTPSDFQEAIQNPRLCFADAELQAGTPTTNALGLPRPITGNFASVYQMNCNGKKYAVRCFLRPQPDRERRYSAISDHLHHHHLPYMVDFKMLEKGIKVRNTWYPILKMEWLDGVTLGEYIESKLHNPSVLKQLAFRFAALVGDLQRAEIAHGDLQHGNILLVDGNLRLIDYDGMYVPELRGSPSDELGHRNYQHPSRTPYDFGPHIDNFSAWVIYLSLLALSFDPTLWKKLKAGDEALLFRGDDFRNLRESPTLKALAQTNEQEVQTLLTTFRYFSSMTLAQIPNLDGAVPQDVPLVQKRRGPGAVWLEDYVQFGENENATRLVESRPTRESARTRLNPAVEKESAQPTRATPTIGNTWIYDHLSPRVAPPPAPPLVPSTPKPPSPPQISERDEIGQKMILVYLSMSGLLFAAAFGGSLPLGLALLTFVIGFILTSSYLLLQYETLPEVRDKAAQVKRVRQARRALKDTYREIESVRDILRLLDEREKNEINDIWQMNERKFIHDQLGQFPLESAHIAGIGHELRARLQRANILTAADVEPTRLMTIEGIGEKRAALLMDWRNDVELRIRATMSRPYTALQINQINVVKRRYSTERTPFEGKLSLLQQSLSQTQNELAHAKQQLATFRHVHFIAYVRAVLFPDASASP